MNPTAPLASMTESRRNHRAWILSAGLALLVLALPFFITNSYYLQWLILALLYAYLSMAWSIIGGMASQLSFGNAIFFGVGAYSSTILFRDLGLSPWLGMLIGAALSGLIALALGLPTFRLRGAYFALATLAFGQIVFTIVDSSDYLLGIEIRGPRGILLPLMGDSPLFFQFDDKRAYYYIIVSLLVILGVVIYRLRQSKLGLYLAAIGSNEEAAMAVGANGTTAKLKAFLLSAFFTALGGTFYAQLLHFVDAPSVLGGDISLLMVLFATAGSPTYLLGPLVGTFVLMPVAEITRVTLGGQHAGIHMVVYGVVLVLIMRFMPRGVLYELDHRWSEARSRRRSKANSAGWHRETVEAKHDAP